MSTSLFHSILVTATTVATFLLLERTAAAQVEDQEEEEEVEGEEGVNLDEPSIQEKKEEGKDKTGIFGRTQLRPPSLFEAPHEEMAEEEEKEEPTEEQIKDEGKTPPTAQEKVVRAPKWEELTTKFFEVTGYFRFRSDLFYRLDMGFPPGSPTGPFPVPLEARTDNPVESNDPPCGSGQDTPKWCDRRLLTGANIRLRIEPIINLSELVKIRAQFDLLDNLVLGTTPEGYTSEPDAEGGLYNRRLRDPWVPLTFFSTTQVPPSWRNTTSNPISVRTAWGEVMLKNIGILKFGRMPSSWGLGILANDGSCLDCDWGDIADRVLFATKLFDMIVAAGWDFPSSGPTSQTIMNHQGQPYDVSLADDLYQWLGVVAYKVEKEEEERRLAMGKPVVSGGIYYLYRKQLLSAMEGPAGPGTDLSKVKLVERDAWAHIADVWLRLLVGDFRAEAEVVLIGGKIGNLGFESYEGTTLDVIQYGGVLQLEHTFLGDALGVKFEVGYASGDQNIEGLSPRQGLLKQIEGKGDDRITAFRFDPDYNVDLILFEEILGQVASSYYFKPSVSYWFVRNRFYGQFDIIYSRASEFISTTGNNANLGVEFNLTLTYKTKDHFTGMLQYAYLIPLAGWKDLPVGPNYFTDLTHPMALQLMLAIEY